MSTLTLTQSDPSLKNPGYAYERDTPWERTGSWALVGAFPASYIVAVLKIKYGYRRRQA